MRALILLILTCSIHVNADDLTSAFNSGLQRSAVNEAINLDQVGTGVDPDLTSDSLLRKIASSEKLRGTSRNAAFVAALGLISKGVTLTKQRFADAEMHGQKLTPQERLKIVKDVSQTVVGDSGGLIYGFTGGELASALVGNKLASQAAASMGGPALARLLVSNGIGMAVLMGGWHAGTQLLSEAPNLLNDADYEKYNSGKLSTRIRAELVKNSAEILAEPDLRDKYLNDLWSKKIATSGFVLGTSGLAAGATFGSFGGPWGTLAGAAAGGIGAALLPESIKRPIDDGIFAARETIEKRSIGQCHADLQMMTDPISEHRYFSARMKPIPDPDQQMPYFDKLVEACHKDRETLLLNQFQRLHNLLLQIRLAQGKTYRSDGSKLSAVLSQMDEAKRRYALTLNGMQGLYDGEVKAFTRLLDEAKDDEQRQALSEELAYVQSLEPRLQGLGKLLSMNPPNESQSHSQNYILSLYNQNFSESNLLSDVQLPNSPQGQPSIANLPNDSDSAEVAR